MKSRLLLALFALFGLSAVMEARATYTITTDTNTHLTTVTFSNGFFYGVSTVEGRSGLRWVPLTNFWTTQRVGQVTVSLPTNYTRFRLVASSIAPGNAFTRLATAYGKISTVAGNGFSAPWVNAWQTNYEGEYATNVVLSDPRNAVADRFGNIYVVERASHAVSKITPDGRLHTFVGTRAPGYTGDAPQFGTNSPLTFPSAIHLAGDHLYILDAGNNRVRVVNVTDPFALVLLVFYDFAGIGPNSAGLWVGEDQDGVPVEAFYGMETVLKHWDNAIVETNGTGFSSLASVVRSPLDRTIVCDSGNHRVYRVRGNGNWTDPQNVIAGTGFAIGNTVGGDADKVALPGVSGIAYLPIGGYFVSLDQGAKVWYVDSDDNAAPFIFGKPGVRAGDGKWFRRGGRLPKIGNVRSLSLAPNGDIILLQSDGYVRKVDFLRSVP